MIIQFKNVLRVAIIVGIILLVPLILTIRGGGVEGVGWNWTGSDFVFMGGLLFCAGLAIDYAVRKITQPTTRLITVLAVVFVTLTIWAQLAVGAVSQLLEFIAG